MIHLRQQCEQREQREFENELKEFFSFPWIIYTHIPFEVFGVFEIASKLIDGDFIILTRYPSNVSFNDCDYDMTTIEDCSACFGLKWKDTYIGTHSKNICIFQVDFGCVIFLPSEQLYKKAKPLFSKPPIHFNFQSSQSFNLLKKNLDKLKDTIYFYKKRISKLREIKIDDFGNLQIQWGGTDCFIAEMKQKGIECEIIQNTQTICIPKGWWLTRENIEYILTSIEEWYHKNKLTFRRLNLSDYDKGYMNLISKTCESREVFNEILSHIDYQLAEIIVGEINRELVCSGRIQVDIHFESPIVRIEDIIVKSGFDIQKRLIQYLTQQAHSYSPSEIIINCRNDELIRICQECKYNITGVIMKL